MNVPATLAREGVPFALVGAVAMAAHGHARSTEDVDFLVADRRVLDPRAWPGGEVRVGDAADPLSGLVRYPGVDVVVIAGAWAAGIVARAGALAVTLDGVRVPVAEAADLVMLKLYAGGPLDLRDAELLLLDPGVAEAAEGRLVGSPEVCARNWGRLRL